MDDAIRYWARMLDESSHKSYYEMYMLENPDDRLGSLIPDLVAEFAQALEKDKIDLDDCLVDGVADEHKLKQLRKKIKTRYRWQRIKPRVYAAAVSRFIALSDRSGGQKLQEDSEISYSDVTHGVSRRTIEGCLDVICHNVNVLEANNQIIHGIIGANLIDNVISNAFADCGIQKLRRHDEWLGKDVEDYGAAISLYIYWAAYAKGRAGDEFTCDSDNGPAEVRKVLDSVEYAADDVDLLVALNKALDIVHFRSDLAAAFIEGGQQTCAMVSNMPAKFVV